MSRSHQSAASIRRFFSFRICSQHRTFELSDCFAHAGHGPSHAHSVALSSHCALSPDFTSSVVVYLRHLWYFVVGSVAKIRFGFRCTPFQTRYVRSWRRCINAFGCFDLLSACDSFNTITGCMDTTKRTTVRPPQRSVPLRVCPRWAIAILLPASRMLSSPTTS